MADLTLLKSKYISLFVCDQEKQKIIHLDIKSANILLSGNWEARIADFGLSKIPPADQSAITLNTNMIAGAIDPVFLLEQVELHISNVKEEAFSRKDILEKIDKWSAACEEETWLDEYNMDQNRYNAGKGTHLLLKCAERAPILVQKIPAMVETLREKAKAWDQKRGAEFTYGGETEEPSGFDVEEPI